MRGCLKVFLLICLGRGCEENPRENTRGDQAVGESLWHLNWTFSVLPFCYDFVKLLFAKWNTECQMVIFPQQSTKEIQIDKSTLIMRRKYTVLLVKVHGTPGSAA